MEWNREILDNITFNCLRKDFPDGSVRLLVADRAIFRELGWEEVPSARKGRKGAPMALFVEGDEELLYAVAERTGIQHDGGPTPEEARRERENRARAMRRARAQLRDLALANPFEWFVTFTLDKEKIDRYDIKAITKKLNAWLDNRVRRRGLAYVLVPERHKDGAIHFHGFINGALDADMVFSGHKDKRGHDIYNVGAWGYGFSTAIRLYGDYHAAVGYVCKYIGKDMPQGRKSAGDAAGGGKIGGRWYYSGGDLKRPAITRMRVEWEAFAELDGAYAFTLGNGVKCVLIEVDGNG